MKRERTFGKSSFPRDGAQDPARPWLAVRRRLTVRPVPRRDPEAADPVDVETALRAVEGEVLKLAFEIRLHVEQLQAQHLGVGDERIGPAVADVDCLVNEVVGLGGLLGDGVDGLFEDMLLARPHCVEPSPAVRPSIPRPLSGQRRMLGAHEGEGT